MHRALDAALAARIKTLAPQLEGWCTVEKALAMAACICEHRPQCCVEIGVLGGRSLLPQALALQHVGTGRLFGIDPWAAAFSLEGAHDRDSADFWSRMDYERLYQQCIRAVRSAGVTSVCTILRAPAECCAELFERIDLLHIDGNHDIQVALRDVKSYLPKVPPGGHVWFDDADWQSTQEALALLKNQCVVVQDFGTHIWFQKRPAATQNVPSRGADDEFTQQIIGDQPFERPEAAPALCKGVGPARRIVLAADDMRCGTYRGGVYNPGAVKLGGGLLLLARNERFTELQRQRNRALWPGTCRPLAISIGRDERIESCRPLEIDDSCSQRAEDFRLFHHAGALQASFSRVITPDRIEQHVAQVDLQAGRLGRPQCPRLDFALQPIEKNWCFFERGEELYLLYSFQPFRLLKLVDPQAFRFETLVHCELTTIAEEPVWRDASLVSLSAIPVEFDDERLLLFVHWRDRAGNYRQHGVLLDRTSLRPVSIARRPLFAGGDARGVHPHVIYLMSIVRMADEFRFFLGEGDQHISQASMPFAKMRSYLADSAAIAGRPIHVDIAGEFHYEHCGLFGRRIRLAADGAILHGAEHDSHWRLELVGGARELWLLGSGRLSCRLRQIGRDDWQGRWNWGTRPLVRLTRLTG